MPNKQIEIVSNLQIESDDVKVQVYNSEDEIIIDVNKIDLNKLPFKIDKGNFYNTMNEINDFVVKTHNIISIRVAGKEVVKLGEDKPSVNLFRLLYSYIFK